MDINMKELVGLGLAGFALVVLGHDIYQTNVTNKALKRVGMSMDEVLNRTEVDISEAVVKKAVASASDREAGKIVSAVSDEIKGDVLKTMRSKVDSAISSIYYSVEDDTKDDLRKRAKEVGAFRFEEITRKLVDDIKSDLERKIEDKLDEYIDDVKERIDDKVEEAVDDAKEQLDDITRKHETQLEETLRIYSSVRKAAGV